MEQITRAVVDDEARGRAIVRVGVDLAKRVIQVHAVDATGAPVCRRALRREAFIAWCARLPAGCVVAMEMGRGAARADGQSARPLVGRPSRRS